MDHVWYISSIYICWCQGQGNLSRSNITVRLKKMAVSIHLLQTQYCLTGWGRSKIRLLVLCSLALQILGRKIYKNTKKPSLYSQSLLFFIHKTPVVESHPTTSEIRDLLWPRSTPMGNTVYFYMSSSLIYMLKIHRRIFKHSVK